jgi:hypothetical protein
VTGGGRNKMKLVDIHGKPIVNRRRAAQEALRQFEEDLEQDREEHVEELEDDDDEWWVILGEGDEPDPDWWKD